MAKQVLAIASFPKATTGLPSDLVGRWTDNQFFYEFKDDGSYLFGGAPVAYNISNDGQTLQLDSTSFQRISGAGTDLEGLWLSASNGTEWRFRADGTSTLHEFNGDSYQGIYETNGSNITRLEKRAWVAAEGNVLTFQPLWGRSESAAYLRAGNELTVIFTSGVYVWQSV